MKNQNVKMTEAKNLIEAMAKEGIKFAPYIQRELSEGHGIYLSLVDVKSILAEVLK